MYRDIMCQGGFPSTGFNDSIAGGVILFQHELFDADDKR